MSPRRWWYWLPLIVVGLLGPSPISAETGDKPEKQTRSKNINHREHRQKKRIQQGVDSGELTREEARQLRQQEAAIHQKEKEMKADGVLTKAERKELQQDLDQTSRDIYEQKHDDQRR